MLAPSQSHAATAAILRSGFMANHEQGAFNIALDSKRTRRALDLLQGLTRDQPLAALYGYRIERGLRDALLGKFIWPLRLAYPWRPVGAAPCGDATDAVGARDVVDGVALLADWEAAPANVITKLNAALSTLNPPTLASAPEQQTIAVVVADALDLADSVSDLLVAEGMHQIVKGNSGARRGGNGGRRQAGAADRDAGRPHAARRRELHTAHRLAVPRRQSTAGPMTADRAPNRRSTPGSHRCSATRRATASSPAFSRTAADGGDVIDADPVVATWAELGVSPLSAILLRRGPHGNRARGPGRDWLS